MSAQSNEKSAEHLMHLIMTRNGEVPNFSLLLGAGASNTSGVKTAEDMIGEWRRVLFSRANDGTGFQEWLAEQSWFNHEDEYSILFETMFDQPSQRRVYIEECVKDAHPSWGYVYLTNLLSNKYFNVVFTTNFDDLINEACYLYSDGLRPLVAAHDSAIQGIRLTSGRPKIIKLHGDFLYDNIKNTLAELETLETNTKRKLYQFAQEYGLVVLGYNGRDRSVMDTLDLLLRDEENFKQGVYWCLRRGATKSRRLQDLLRRERVYLVEIDGFDEFAADINKAARLTLPKAIARPLDMARDRARLFVAVDYELRSHPVIASHVTEILGGISTHIPQLPLPVEAAILTDRGEFDKAIPLWERAFYEDPDDTDIAYRYADALADAGKDEELAKFVTDSPIQIYNTIYFLLRAGRNQEVIDQATLALADPTTGSREIVRINRAIALKRLGRIDEMNADLEFMELNGDTEQANIRAGVAALRGDREEMFAALNEAMYKSIFPQNLTRFPVFEDYKDDSEFLEIIRTSASDD